MVGPLVTPHTWGRSAEAHVAALLVADGWTVRGTNVRLATGELDLVVERAGVLRFVEVKARTSDTDDALQALTLHKQRRLRAAGEAWIAAHGTPEKEVAFLVAVVDLGRPDWPVGWIDDAF